MHSGFLSASETAPRFVELADPSPQTQVPMWERKMASKQPSDSRPYSSAHRRKGSSWLNPARSFPGKGSNWPGWLTVALKQGHIRDDICRSAMSYSRLTYPGQPFLGWLSPFYRWTNRGSERKEPDHSHVAFIQVPMLHIRSLKAFY